MGTASKHQARRLITTMNKAFDGAAVPQEAVNRLRARDDQPHERPARPRRRGGQRRPAIITLNLKDFQIEACEPFAIEPLHPDAFLIDLYHLDADAVFEAVERQAAVLYRPPMTLHELLNRLTATVPDFAETLRHHR